jgi:N-acyl-phosphatidylethanolamine-hydrolysing phospholipase D
VKSESGRHGLSLEDYARKKMHHLDGRFQNPFRQDGRRNIWQVLKWRLFSQNAYQAHYGEEPTVTVDIDWPAVKRYRGFSITFITHACLMIKDVDAYILVDPVFFGLFPMVRNFTPLAFDLASMPAPDMVLITHGHYDHLDRPSLAALRPSTHVVTPLGYRSILKSLHMDHCTELDWFDSYAKDGRRITLLPCNHWTLRNPWVGADRSLWGSYLIQGKSGQTLLIGGDTAYFEELAQIGERFDIDLVVFNLGAYEPRWFMRQSHMNPAETVTALQNLRARKMLLVHWGTFRLGDEPVHFPPLHLKQELMSRGLSHRYLDWHHGQTLYLDDCL